MADSDPLTELDDSIFDSVLCIAAHPDDLEYGAAAAVDKWVRAGKRVSYLLVTRGEAGIDTMAPEQAGPARQQEERDGAAAVGVHVVDFLDGFADGTVEYGLSLRRAIVRHIRSIRPDLLLCLTHAETFAGGGLNQADHRAVGLAALDARADAGNRWIFPELVEQGLEPWPVTHVFSCSDPQPTHYVDVTGHFDAAVASLSAHARYLAALGADYPEPAKLLSDILGSHADRVEAEHALVGRLLA